MGAEDDIEVKMRVVLDDEDIRKQVAGAEQKMGGAKKGGGAAPPMPGSAASFRDIGKAIADAMRSQQSNLAGGKLAAFGDAAKPLAAGFFALGIAKQLHEAVRSVISNLLSLGGSLARFSPDLSVAFRSLSVNMRMLSIDMARVLGPALSDLVRSLGELVRTVYQSLRPALFVVAGLIKVASVAIGFVTDAIRRMSSAVALATWGLAKLASGIADLLSAIFPNLAAGLKLAANALEQSAKKWMEAIDGKGRTENLLNTLLIRGLTEAASQKATFPRASGEQRTNGQRHRSAPVPADARSRDGSASVAAGRVPVPAPVPTVASMITNVNSKTEFKVENERAVMKALEEVRRMLTESVMKVRNDQILLANRLAGATVVDLVA